jgi:hypothetical protein
VGTIVLYECIASVFRENLAYGKKKIVRIMVGAKPGNSCRGLL